MSLWFLAMTNTLLIGLARCATAATSDIEKGESLTHDVW